MNPRDRDRALARERMRHLREAGDGLTISDRARIEATQTLIKKYRLEYDLLRSTAYYRMRKELG